MTVCWFGMFRRPEPVDQKELVWLRGFLTRTPNIRLALIYTPSTTTDPYLDDGAPPALGLQLYFDDIADLEAVTARDGHLQGLAAREELTRAEAAQQAMLVRRFPVPDPGFNTPAGELPCTYLVAYEGTAENLNEWLAYYIASHPPIMARFPGIRQIEICTRIDWCGFLPWRRVEHMQRNKVVFDSTAALRAALNSPVRHEMRADFVHFPPFTGPVTHFPMLTTVVRPPL